MLTVVLTRPGLLEVVEQPDPPPPGEGEVLVAVRRVGICGTDYHAYRGAQNFVAYPCVLGHELAVEVLEVGPAVDDLVVGQWCAVLPYLSCGRCRACLRGRTNCCEVLRVLGVTEAGGLSERMVLPASHLIPGPGLTLDQLVLVETLGIGWHAVSRGQPRPDDSVLVLGAGPVGLAVAQAVRRTGARVLVADISSERARLAAATGVDTVVADDGFEEVLRERHGGGLPELVFDASGSRTSMEAAFEMVGSCGTLVLVGHTTASVTFRNPGFHARELDLRASRNATREDWAQVIVAIGDGTLDALPWVNHRTTLPALVEELPRLAADPGPVVKAVVEIGPTSAGTDQY